MIDLDTLELDLNVWQIERETLDALIAELREKRSDVEGFRMALTTCRQERAMAEAMVGTLERRISQLEDVREAAGYVLANLDADDGTYIPWSDELRGALAEMEGK